MKQAVLIGFTIYFFHRFATELFTGVARGRGGKPIAYRYEQPFAYWFIETLYVGIAAFLCYSSYALLIELR